MRMILGLSLASSQSLFSVGAGNLPETCGADGIREGCPLIRYQKYRKGEPFGKLSRNDARRAGEPA